MSGSHEPTASTPTFGRECPDQCAAMSDLRRLRLRITAGNLACHEFQKICRNAQKRKPESIIATGRVSTHASARLRTVAHCRPE